MLIILLSSTLVVIKIFLTFDQQNEQKDKEGEETEEFKC